MTRPFTFKLDPKPRGLQRAVSLGRGADIRLGGKYVGRISAPHWGDDGLYWRVAFRVRIEGHPGWRMARLAARFDDYASAKTFVTSRAAKLQESLDLLPAED
jgi:hypothetical protein